MPRRWSPRFDPVTVDRVLAGLLLVGALVQAALWQASAWDRLTAAVLGVLLMAGLAVRRRWPALVGIGTQALLVLRWHLDTVQDGPGPPAVLVAWLCALYALAVWSGTRWFLVGTAFFVVSDLVPWPGTDSQDFSFTVLVAFGMVMVRVVVGGRDRALLLAERERRVAAREAVVEERARIARELHDVIAHHVSTMVLQAGAERRAVEAPETREVLSSIEHVGRAALREMRRMVAMLRDGTPDDLGPQPRLGDLPLLVGQLQESGLDVHLEVRGEARELPEGIELSAYRIVQEALTNALKHARGSRAEVRVGYGAESLELEIVNQGGVAPEEAPEPGGHGLVGMRERVTMYGGRFEAGRQQDGAFGVRVLLPVS